MINSSIQSDKLYMTIDQGGHASRVLVFDAQKECVAQSSVAISTLNTEQGFIEHDPVEMIDSIRQALTDVAAQLGANMGSIQSAGLATQRSSLVCWNRDTGEALTPIISWQDRRAAELVERVAASKEVIRHRTGLFPNPHYGASKMAWCLEHVAAVKTAQKNGQLVIGPLSSFITYHIIEGQPVVADPANASRTMLVNLATQDWDEELLELFGIPQRGDGRGILPQLVPTVFEYGELLLSDRLIPVNVVTGDQSAALFAGGQAHAKTVYVNAGTGAFVQAVIDDPGRIPLRLLGSVVYRDATRQTIVMEGTVNGAARALHWFAEQKGIEAIDDFLLECTRKLKDEEDLPLFVNGISGVGSPYWLSELDSHFVGKQKNASAQVIAILESIVFLIMRNLEEMRTAFPDVKRIKLSGGLSNVELFCQRLADLAEVPIIQAEFSEATCLGLLHLLTGGISSSDSPATNEAGKLYSPRNTQSCQALVSRYQDWRTAMDSFSSLA